MRRAGLLLLCAVLLGAATQPRDQASLDPVRSMQELGADVPLHLVHEGFDYGAHRSGRVDIDVSPLRGQPPLVVEISFSGESRLPPVWMPSFLHGQGLRIAYIRPEEGAAEHDARARAASVAKGLAALIAKAGKYRFDPSRILLVGGALDGQLVALLGTDPSYAAEAGIPFASLRGAIILDGAGFDLPAYVASRSGWERKQVLKAVGSDAAALSLASPLTHAEAPNAPFFLLVPVAGDSESQSEAERLARAVRAGGSSAEILPLRRTSAKDPATFPGHPNNPGSAALARWLARAAGTRTD